MPKNPWLALDVKTSPAQRARELRRVWDDFLGSGRIDAVRRPIAESWRRSQAAGLDPTFGQVPTMVADRRDVEARWEAHPLVAVAPLVRESLVAIADESDHLIVVSDADGLLLWQLHSRSRSTCARVFGRGMRDCTIDISNASRRAGSNWHW
jgi:transcriptional regulator of acetoin/glycerol metabolism